ncbi:MAG: branched-chain amino acid transporter ATP-binding protein [Pseudomonadota bacterium]|jgi:branched-chain amino acid transport system ATP-binding protein
MSQDLLVVKNLVKRFGGLTAVDHVSFEVAPGRILGVIGPNGSGKTTLFANVSGFQTPEEGEVIFNGQPITGLRPSEICSRGIARTFQIVQPFAGLSVFDNVVTGALRGGRTQLDEAKERAAQVIALCGLTPVSSQLAGALPIAGRKRLEVARALATQPKLLLLDEVMAGLRPTEVDQAVELVFAIRDSGITVILVEHLMRAVMALCEELMVLQQGKLIARGEPRAVCDLPEVVRAYFGESAKAAA